MMAQGIQLLQCNMYHTMVLVRRVSKLQNDDNVIFLFFSHSHFNYQ